MSSATAIDAPVTARAVGNLIGNCVATVVVAAWEGDLDRDKAEAALNGDTEKALQAA